MVYTIVLAVLVWCGLFPLLYEFIVGLTRMSRLAWPRWAIVVSGPVPMILLLKAYIHQDDPTEPPYRYLPTDDVREEAGDDEHVSVKPRSRKNWNRD